MSGNGDMQRIPAAECFQVIVRIPGREQRMFVMRAATKTGQLLPASEILGRQWSRWTGLALQQIKKHFDDHPEK